MTSFQEITIDGHKLVARTFNPTATGTPIILLHGITASINWWIPSQLTPFNQHGPCYALSLPGHYPATFPQEFTPSDLTAEWMASLLAKAIQQLVGEQPVILAGHSTGGFAALNIAAHNPAVVAGVVSISGFAHGRWTGLLGFCQKILRLKFGGEFLFNGLYKVNRATKWGQRASWRVYVADPRHLFASPEFTPLFEAIYPTFKQLDLEAMRYYFQRMPEIDITPLLARIESPVLALTGERDPIVPAFQAKIIANSTPHGTLATIPNVGHMPTLEAPTQFEELVNSWFATHITTLS